MKKNCKNCTYLYAFQRNLWCTRQLQHTEADGCCNEYKRKPRVSVRTAQMVALVASSIALVLSLIRLICL